MAKKTATKKPEPQRPDCILEPNTPEQRNIAAQIAELTPEDIERRIIEIDGEKRMLRLILRALKTRAAE